jgi:hypothetical protein
MPKSLQDLVWMLIGINLQMQQAPAHPGERTVQKQVFQCSAVPLMAKRQEKEQF